MPSPTSIGIGIGIGPLSLIFPAKHSHFHRGRPRPRMATCGAVDNGVRTLIECVGGEGDDLVLLFHHLQYACKRIAALVASPFNSTLGNHNRNHMPLPSASSSGSDRDAPKPLDIVSVSFNLLLVHYSLQCAMELVTMFTLLLFGEFTYTDFN